MIIKEAINILELLKHQYRKYLKKTDAVYRDMCELQILFENSYLRSGNDFINPENIVLYKQNFESLVAAYKCCFVEHSDNIGKLKCYTFMLEIHNNSFDVLLDLNLN